MELTWIDGVPDFDNWVGLVLKMDDGTIQLVGHINKEQGVCDCCYVRDEEIVAYSKSLLPLLEELEIC